MRHRCLHSVREREAAQRPHRRKHRRRETVREALLFRPSVESLEARLYLNADFEFEVVTTTNAEFLSLGSGPSINDQGNVAFVATTNEGESVFFWQPDGSDPARIAGPTGDNSSFDSWVTLNDNNVVLVRRTTARTETQATVVQLLDADLPPGSRSVVVATGGRQLANGTHPDPFDVVQPYGSINNNVDLVHDGHQTQVVSVNNNLVYTALPVGSASPVIETPPSAGSHPSGDAQLPRNAMPQLELSDRGTVIARAGRSPGDSIIFWKSGLTSETSLSSVFTSVSAYGAAPSVSDDGEVIAFYAEDTQGPGIFAASHVDDRWVLYRVAGISGDGVMDAGEQLIDSVDVGPFASFTPEDKVTVRVATNGSDYTVLYFATDLDGTSGLYVSTLDTSDSAIDVSSPTLVIEIGATVDELLGGVEHISVHDPLNSHGDIVFRARTSLGETAIVKASPGTHELTHAKLEVLARDIAYRRETDLVAGDNAIVFGYHVDKVFSDSTKFFAVGLTCDQCTPVLAIRGTVPTQISTVFSDFHTNGVGFNQFAHAYRDFADTGDVSSDNVFGWLSGFSDTDTPAYITGHSLGGALTQWIAADFTSRGGHLGEIVTFNSPGISHEYAHGAFVVDHADAVMHYITNGDLVSMAGEAFLPGSYTLSTFKSEFNSALDILALVGQKHGLPVLVGKIEGESGPRLRPPGLNRSVHSNFDWLESPQFVFSDPDYHRLVSSIQVFADVTGDDLLDDIASRLLLRGKVEEARRIIGDVLQDMVDSGAQVTVQIDASLPLARLGFDDLEIASTQLKVSARPSDDGSVDQLAIQGSVELPLLFQAKADLSGDNYIAITDEGLELKGVISLKNIPLDPAGVWVLEEVTLSIDSETRELVAGGRLKIPTGIVVDASLGFQNGEFDSLSIGINGLDKPIGTTGAFLQRLGGKVDHVSSSDPDPVEFGGAVGVTAGPEITFSLPSWLGGDISGSIARLDVEGTIDRNQLTASGQLKIAMGIAEGNGAAVLNWNDGFLTASGRYSALGGLIQEMEAGFVADSRLNVSMVGNARVTLPKIPFTPLMGQSVASAQARIEYRNDLAASNDFIDAWGTVDLGLFGEALLGVRVDFSGDWDIIGSFSVLKGPSSARRGAGLNAEPVEGSYVVTDPQDDLILLAEWENSSPDTPFEVVSPQGLVLTADDIANSPSMSFIDAFGSPTSLAVGIVDPAPGRWHVRIPDSAGLGVVRFHGLARTAEPTARIVDLISNDDTVGIEFEAFDPDSSATVGLYYDIDATGADGVFIGEARETDGHGSLSWNTFGIPAGAYYVYAIVDDGDHPGSVVYAATTVDVPASVVAQDDEVAVPQDGEIVIDLLVNDRAPGSSLDPSAVSITIEAEHGMASLDSLSGELTYVPRSGFMGLDDLAYTVQNIDGVSSNEATVTIDVRAAEESPMAEDDNAFVMEGQSITIEVLRNDTATGARLNPASVVVVQPPEHGNVTIDLAAGTITYTPEPSYQGSDSFAYTVEDEHGSMSSEATVFINVRAAYALLGDMNGDGMLNNLDIGAFRQALNNRAIFTINYPDVDPDVAGDITGDGKLDIDDVGPFAVLMTSDFLPDWHEPNDTFDLATDLQTIASWKETGLTLHVSDNEDYFKFRLADTLDARIALQADTQVGNLDLYLYNAEERLIAAAESDDEIETIVCAGPTNPS